MSRIGSRQLRERRTGKLIVRLAREWGIGILLVEHDVPLVLSVWTRSP